MFASGHANAVILAVACCLRHCCCFRHCCCLHPGCCCILLIPGNFLLLPLLTLPSPGGESRDGGCVAVMGVALQEWGLRSLSLVVTDAGMPKHATQFGRNVPLHFVTSIIPWLTSNHLVDLSTVGKEAWPSDEAGRRPTRSTCTWKKLKGMKMGLLHILRVDRELVSGHTPYAGSILHKAVKPEAAVRKLSQLS
jgi:hypothetical protein